MYESVRIAVHRRGVTICEESFGEGKSDVMIQPGCGNDAEGNENPDILKLFHNLY